MIRDAVMESIAVSVLVAAATLPVACVSLPKVEPNLQPIVAVGGTYAMMEATRRRAGGEQVLDLRSARAPRRRLAGRRHSESAVPGMQRVFIGF